jgi:hypothetical protein
MARNITLTIPTTRFVKTAMAHLIFFDSQAILSSALMARLPARSLIGSIRTSIGAESTVSKSSDHLIYITQNLGKSSAVRKKYR